MILSDIYILKNHVKINKIKLYIIVAMQIIFLLVEMLVFTEWVSLNNGKSKTFYVQETFITLELSLIACYKKTRLHF